MILSQLHIINFKGIEAATLSLSPKVNCFVGLNGMGKTNVLDALHYLALTKSHLSIPDSLAVRHGAESAILDGTYRTFDGEERHILLQIRPGQRKILKRNRKEYDRLATHIGQFPLIIISPQDQQLIIGGSEERRRFVDLHLSQLDVVYLTVLTQYNRLLQQRNSLLKSPTYSDALVDVLDMQMDHAARALWSRRNDFVRQLVPEFADIYAQVAHEQYEVSLQYQSQLSATEGTLYELLRQHRERDRMLGYTTVGVHRDDLAMLLGTDPIKRIGSQGQNKTYLISLKLAQYRLLSQHMVERPMLLLDDIFDKLDAERVQRIIHLVGGEDFGQIFITDTNRKYLDEIIQCWGQDYHLYGVSSGQIQRLE